MIIYASVLDLLSLPQFKGMKKEELLKKENDSVILNLLHPYGVDNRFSLSVQACKHRTNTGKLVTDWRYIFRERTDKQWIRGGKASIEARAYASGDKSLLEELASMGGLYRASTDGSGKTRKTEDEFDKDWEDVQTLILMLQDAQKRIRGELLADEDVLYDKKTSREMLQGDFDQMERFYNEKGME